MPSGIRSRFSLSPAAVVAGVLLLAASPVQAQSQEPPIDTVRQVGTLRSGDMLAVMVHPEVDLGGEFIVDDRGYVQLVAGLVRVAGLAPAAARDSVIAAFRRMGILEPYVRVEPLIRVHVLGAVARPGVHPVPPGTMLIDLVSIAGGPTAEADLERAHVARGTQRVGIDLRDALNGGFAGRYAVYSNDIVFIPPRNRFVRENLNTILASVGALLTIVNLAITMQNR